MLDVAFDSVGQEPRRHGFDAGWRIPPAASEPSDSRKSPRNCRRELKRAWRAAEVLDLDVAIDIAGQVDRAGGPGGVAAPLRIRTLLRAMHERHTITDVEVVLLVRVIMRRLQAPAQTTAATPRYLAGPLSERQRAVLQLIGQGRSNKQIARDLNLAPETVKSYVKQIFVKLGTQTRAQSVSHGAKLGIL